MLVLWVSWRSQCPFVILHLPHSGRVSQLLLLITETSGCCCTRLILYDLLASLIRCPFRMPLLQQKISWAVSHTGYHWVCREQHIWSLQSYHKVHQHYVVCSKLISLHLNTCLLQMYLFLCFLGSHLSTPVKFDSRFRDIQHEISVLSFHCHHDDRFFSSRLSSPFGGEILCILFCFNFSL